MKIVFLASMLPIAVAGGGTGYRPTFRELAEKARAGSPELQLSRLEALARISESRASYGALVPEFGVEGGLRSNREREKRNDFFYYGYGRLEISLKEIFELRAAQSRQDLAQIENNQVLVQTERFLGDLYYSAFFLQGELALKKEDLDLTEKHIVAARRRVDSGLATETDLLEFRMHQQEKRNDIQSLELELQRQYLELQRFAGLNESIAELKEDSIELKTLEGFDVIWPRVMNNNIELRRARTETFVAASEKSAALGGYFPRLSAEAQYGKLAETDFVESRKNSWAVVGKVTLPVLNGFSDFNRLESKSYEADRASLAEAQIEAKVRQMTQSLILMVEGLVKKLEGERKNIETAEQYYKAVVSEYRRGVKNSADMAGAADKFFEAKLRALEADRDLNIATIELLAMQGLSAGQLRR